MMGTLGRIPVETRSAPKREIWQLSLTGAASVSCAGPGECFGGGGPGPLTKRFVSARGRTVPVRESSWHPWACRYRPQVLQNTRARRPQK